MQHIHSHEGSGFEVCSTYTHVRVQGSKYMPKRDAHAWNQHTRAHTHGVKFGISPLGVVGRTMRSAIGSMVSCWRKRRSRWRSTCVSAATGCAVNKIRTADVELAKPEKVRKDLVHQHDEELLVQVLL